MGDFRAESLDAAVLDLVHVGLFAIDRLWRVILWNRTLETWTGRSRAAALGRDVRSLFPALAEARYSGRIEPLFEGGPPVVFSHQLNSQLFVTAREDGRERRYGCVACGMKAEGVLLFTVEDRTESAGLLADSRRELALRTAAEERLQASIKVQEMLAREASHRVKNSLTIIVSLIAMESAQIKDKESKALLDSLEARIQSISLIHENLYKGTIGEDIDLDDYLDGVCRSVFSTLLPPDSPARLELSLTRARLEVEKTLYLGLAIVELMTNAIKYAIVPRGTGLIRVALRSPREELLELEVVDDGPGFGHAASESAHPKSSLGRGLLSMLASELGAELVSGAGEGGGARVAMVFPFRPRT